MWKNECRWEEAYDLTWGKCRQENTIVAHGNSVTTPKHTGKQNLFNEGESRDSVDQTVKLYT